MIIRKQDCVMEIDLEKTKGYYATHSPCSCAPCRNYYAQVASRLPQLAATLAELGIAIARPDELMSIEGEGEIQYLSASYTVCGKVLEKDEYELDLFEGGSFFSIVIGDGFVPNEQTGEYFIVGIYGITLPWVLDEPFPAPTPFKRRASKPKALFKKAKERLRR